MQHLLTPYSKAIEPFAWWEGGFTEEQLDWLQNHAQNAKIEAQVGGGGQGVSNSEIRRSELNWLHKNDESAWVFNKLSHIVSTLNVEHFKFNLTGFSEALQLTNYNGEKQGHYTWHQDFGSTGVSRKLSVVVQLSNPEEYEGGQLQLLTSKNPINIKKQRGLVVVFPSWTLHRVTPVTSGTRQTLVTWISGPAFT
jgi:PKHD-type hydroxylase